MTQEEILEFNKRCAEFLGLKIENGYIRNTYEIESFFPLLGYGRPVEQLQFHSDWNWIKEVIKAIEMIEKDWPISTDEVLSLSLRSDKDTVAQTINQFLIWYNNENKRN